MLQINREISKMNIDRILENKAWLMNITIPKFPFFNGKEEKTSIFKSFKKKNFEEIISSSIDSIVPEIIQK